MKNFSLGVLVMLCVGLMIQNSHLHSQIALSNKSQSTPSPVATAKIVKRAQKTPVVAMQPVRPDNYNQYNGTPPASDPRCPSHLPYYDGRWGCVVKRP